MNKVIVKAARFIFIQRKNDGFVFKDDLFDATCVYLRYFDEKAENCGIFCSFRASPSIYASLDERRKRTAYAAHCDGLGPQLYVTTFEVMVYDENNHDIPILFSHSVGS